MKVYLSGPMSGKPKYNKDAFDAAESHWVDRGHEVFNPSSQGYDAPPSEHYKTYLPQDIRDVLDCDAVVVSRTGGFVEYDADAHRRKWNAYCQAASVNTTQLTSKG